MRRRIRKFAQNIQVNKQVNKQTEVSKTEATLSPVVCGSSGNAGQYLNIPLRSVGNYGI